MIGDCGREVKLVLAGRGLLPGGSCRPMTTLLPTRGVETSGREDDGLVHVRQVNDACLASRWLKNPAQETEWTKAWHRSQRMVSFRPSD